MQPALASLSASCPTSRVHSGLRRPLGSNGASAPATGCGALRLPPAAPSTGCRREQLARHDGLLVSALPQQQRRRRVRVAATPGDAHAHPQQPQDEFVQAARRLQNLLAGVGDGESELLDSSLADEPPEGRIMVLFVLGSVLGGVAVAISLLAGQDPLGGMSPSLHSLSMALVGLVASSPLLAFRVWSWRPEAAQVLPAFEDMHLAQVTNQAPWLANTRPWHVAAMTLIESVPSTLLVLPAAQGALLAATHMYSTALQSLGAPATASPGVLQLSCLLFTAAGAALAKGLELGVSDQEYEVVQTAVDNSDRYYRLMADRGSRAAEAALAFRSVAQAWLGARNDASLAVMVVSGADVLALGGLWYATGDLAAPLVAAVALNGVDAWHIHQVVRRREERARGATSSPPSTGAPRGYSGEDDGSGSNSSSNNSSSNSSSNKGGSA